MGGLAVVYVVVLGGALACVEPPEAVSLALDSCAISPEGALCDDGRPCTVGDKCMSSVCVGIVAPDGSLCTDGDVCTITDTCDKGICIGLPAPDNHPCTDGEPCTEPDTCQMGTCRPGLPRICSDGNSCTADMCLIGVGCQFMSVPDCTPPPPEVPDAAMDLVTDIPLGDIPVADVPVADVPGGDLSLPDVSTEAVGDSIPPADAVDVGMAETDDAPPGDAPVDEGADAEPPEPGSDGSLDTTKAMLDLRARGGACVCAVGEPPPPFGGVATIGLAVLMARRRRKAA